MKRFCRAGWHPALLSLLIVAYVAVFGALSLRRHQNLRTNALDLGYTDQAVWNTLHGRPFRFSTYLDAAFHLDIPIQDFRQPEVLLGYHVEPILAPIALLYLLHDGPETLLWLQTVVIALGAIPLYLLARRRFGHSFAVGKASPPSRPPRTFGAGGKPDLLPVAKRTGGTEGGRSPNPLSQSLTRWLPVAFVLLYLLSPSLEAANLSDFHAVALSPLFLLFAFYFLETDRPWGFVAFAFLAAMCKEEVGLLAAMMGLWAALVRRRWTLGLGVAVAGAGWSLLCFAVIMPHFSGLGSSAFWVRYGQFGGGPLEVARNLLAQPGLFVDWLRRPDVLRYLRDLWLSSGGLAILHPLSLAMALPSLAINTFSSYGWMHSGGGHYSVTIVPFLVISAVYGVGWVTGRIRKAGNRGIRESGEQGIGERGGHLLLCLVLVGLGLGVALVNHYYNGISPPSRRFVLEPVSEHARRAAPFFERLNRLPPDVPISVGSNLYPHVGHREQVYLFPTVSDAQFILLDVTGPASPVGAGDQRQIVRELLDYAQFGVAASDHGFLLLERDLNDYRLSSTFHEVFYAEGALPQTPVGADFGGLLRLEGFDWNVRPVVRQELLVEITTYWRPLATFDDEYRLVFYFWDEEGRLVRVQPEERALHWYPTWLWEPGQVVKVTLPPLPVGDLPHAGVALLRPGTENTDVKGRVPPILSTSGQLLSLWEQNTILELIKP